MILKETPIKIEGITDNIYAGFWIRLASILLDILIMCPLLILKLFADHISISAYIISSVSYFLIAIWYNIYLVKKYGGTPGKLITGIKIIKLNSDDISWKEAILREIVTYCISAFGVALIMISLIKADAAYYVNLSWAQQSHYLYSLYPISHFYEIAILNIWGYSELIVLLTNKRKRAIHDFIAGTVIVKKKYINKLREVMNEQE